MLDVLLFFSIFSPHFFSPSLAVWVSNLKPYSVNSLSPSLYLVSQWLSRVGHQPSTITRSLTVLPLICLRLNQPRYPSGHPRRKSAQSLPIITHHLPGHVKNLQPHVPLVQHTRHPPAEPSVQSQLHPIIRSSGELPRAGCYFQSNGGKLERGGISSRRNLCCERQTDAPCRLSTRSVRLSTVAPLSVLLRQPAVLDTRVPHNWQSQRSMCNLSPVRSAVCGKLITSASYRPLGSETLSPTGTHQRSLRPRYPLSHRGCTRTAQIQFPPANLLLPAPCIKAARREGLSPV